jgi:hypothetical protein
LGKILEQSKTGCYAWALIPNHLVEIDAIAQLVAQLLDMSVQEVWQPGKYQRLVIARSLLCFWAV